MLGWLVRKVEEMAELNFLDTSKARFRTSAGGLVSFAIGDKFYPKVDLHMAFPFTDPDRYISVREPEGDEITLIRNLKDLDAKSQEAIRTELSWRYYTPKIKRIEEFKEEFGHTYWEVETDRGYHKFVTRGRDQTVRTIDAQRTLIIDVSGNRFEIEDVDALDSRSRDFLELLL